MIFLLLYGFITCFFLWKPFYPLRSSQLLPVLISSMVAALLRLSTSGSVLVIVINIKLVLHVACISCIPLFKQFKSFSTPENYHTKQDMFPNISTFSYPKKLSEKVVIYFSQGQYSVHVELLTSVIKLFLSKLFFMTTNWIHITH